MKRVAGVFTGLACFTFIGNLSHCVAASEKAIEFRRLSLQEYRDKMKAGWIGQMVGVTWGAPTEFKFKDQIIPARDVPVWKPETINAAFNQDDLYVEMTFLRSLEQHGLDVSIAVGGIAGHGRFLRSAASF